MQNQRQINYKKDWLVNLDWLSLVEKDIRF